METMYVELSSIDKVKDFVNEISKIEGEFDLVSGRYVVDAKSIMGIFSLDLSKSMQLNAKSEDKESLKILKKYTVEEK